MTVTLCKKSRRGLATWPRGQHSKKWGRGAMAEPAGDLLGQLRHVKINRNISKQPAVLTPHGPHHGRRVPGWHAWVTWEQPPGRWTATGGSEHAVTRGIQEAGAGIAQAIRPEDFPDPGPLWRSRAPQNPHLRPAAD